MCSSFPHALSIGLIISCFSIGLCTVADSPIDQDVMPTVNSSSNYRSPWRTPDHRNRSRGSEKNRGRHQSLHGRVSLTKKRQRQKILEHMSDQEAFPNSLSVNGSVDANLETTTESELKLRKALRQKRRKLKRLWQEIERIQRALKVTDVGRQRNGKDQEDGGVKVKVKNNRKSHWRRRMMQRLKLLSRQLQEQQQRTPSMDTVEKLYALLALEPLDGPGKGSRGGNNVADRNGRRTADRKQKKHRGHFPKGNSTTVLRGSDIVLPESAARSGIEKPHDHRNRSVHHGTGIRQRSGHHGDSRFSKTGSLSVAGAGRTGVKKGEAGSVCATHKNCKPGFCCHVTHSVKSSSLNASNSVCVEHRLKQGQPCSNSCQCDNGLQCFISRKDKMYHKRLPPPDSSASWSSSQGDEGAGAVLMTGSSNPSSNDGQCKIPAMDDVLHGIYIIGDHALFNSSP